MAATTVYSTSQTATYDATGTLDRDLSPIITNITPDKTPLLNKFHTGRPATEMKVEWHIDKTRPPHVNQRPEMDEWNTFKDAGNIGTQCNYVQIFREDGRVSDIMKSMVDKNYTPNDELARQKTKKIKELAKDMEYAIMVNATAHAESTGVNPMMGGIPYFLGEEVINVTATTAGVFTAASAHNLLTGEWVMFKATAGNTLPTEIDANRRYYICQDATTPATVFTIFEELEDAIQAAATPASASPITFASAITAGKVQILLNNVVDVENAMYTEDDINAAMEMAAHRGGDPTMALMSSNNKRRFSDILNQVHTVNKDQSDSRVRDLVTVYESDFGTITAEAHLNCTNRAIYLMDLNNWAIRWLDKPHIVAEDKLPKTGSYSKFIVTGAMTLECSYAHANAVIKGIKDPRSAVNADNT